MFKPYICYYPCSLKSIGENAFSITRINDVYINDVSSWCNITFGDNPLCNNLYINDVLVEVIVISEGVEKISAEAFNGCKSVSSIKIPASVKSIGNNALGDTISSVYISDLSAWCGIDFGDDFTVANLFLNNTPIVNLVIPDDVKIISDRAFNGVTSIESVTIPDGVESVGAYAFEKCSGLKTATIGAEIIGERAFDYCENLSSVTIGKGLKKIGKYAFYECLALKNITVPKTVTSIGEYSIGYYRTYHYRYGYEIPTPYIMTIHALENSSAHYYAKGKKCIQFSLLEQPFAESVLYFVPGAQWLSNNARFAVNITNSEGVSQWVSMTDADCDGMYEAVIPEGEWMKAYFSRLNGKTTENSEDNQFNRSVDVTFSDKYNCYVITEPWDSKGIGSGAWYQYNKETDEMTIRKIHELSLRASSSSAKDRTVSFIGDKLVVDIKDRASSFELYNTMQGNIFYVNGGQRQNEDTADLTERQWFEEYQSIGDWYFSEGVYVFTISNETEKAITFSCQKALRGDFDTSGAVDVKDVTYMQKALADLATVTSNNIVLGDANGNGKLDIRDATYVQMLIAKMIDKLPYTIIQESVHTLMCPLSSRQIK